MMYGTRTRTNAIINSIHLVIGGRTVMKSTVIRKGITASVILGVGALLSGCGGGGGGSSAASFGSTPTNNNVITGYTKDEYFSASVYIYGFNNNSATLCNSGTSLSNGYFSISLNSCSGPYLVVATASSGTDAGTYYYITNQTSNPIYVTPASTVIVEEYAPAQGSATIVLSQFKSSNLLTNIINQENVYNNNSVSFTHIPVPVNNGSYTVEYIYPLLNTASVPILVKGFNGSPTSLETAFGSFSNGTLYLYSNTQGTANPSYSAKLSNLVPSSLSNITFSSYNNITSVLSPTPMIIPSISFFTYIYEDEGKNVFNVPIIKVYIDGQPVNLILDTGDYSGLVVNQSAVNIPPSDYINNTNLASATVCLNPNIISSCVVMPIGVTSETLFPGEPNEGVFGLAEADISNGNSITVFPYPYYLEKQTGINSYQLSFISLSNNYYANLSQTQPIGQISFGNYNGNYNALTPYNFGISVTFGSYPYNTTERLTFNTALVFNLLSEKDLASVISNYSPTQQEGTCIHYNFVVNSSYTISYTMQSYTGSFVTEPPTSFCNNPPAFNLLMGITVDNTTYDNDIFPNAFGLPAMLGHTFTYVLGAPGSPNQGLIEYLGISP